MSVNKQEDFEYTFTTAEFAQANGIQSSSLTVHLSKRGSYYGIVPKKQANGRLLWPADEIDRLVSGDPVQATADAR